MRDWHVGQKIVCVNAQPIDGLRNRFVDEYLREGKVYQIRKILMFNFRVGDKSEEKLSFRLESIVPHLIDGIEYAFFHGRFRPFEDQDDDEEIDVSIFLEALRQVNEGIFTLRNEDIRELESLTLSDGRRRAGLQRTSVQLVANLLSLSHVHDQRL